MRTGPVPLHMCEPMSAYLDILPSPARTKPCPLPGCLLFRNDCDPLLSTAFACRSPPRRIQGDLKLDDQSVGTIFSAFALASLCSRLHRLAGDWLGRETVSAPELSWLVALRL